MLAIDLLGDCAFQTIKIFKSKTCCQFIINAGIGLFMKLIQFHFENSQFTSQMGSLIIFWEGYWHIDCCPQLCTNNTVFKTRYKAV